MTDDYRQDDPFKKYGGQQIADQDDPFKKYGGSAIVEPPKKKDWVSRIFGGGEKSTSSSGRLGELAKPNEKLHNNSASVGDKEFQKWYAGNTLEGKNKVPYSNDLAYDYYSFYKNKGVGNINDHFPDTYKRPNHPTFSDESLYSTKDNPGGHWEGEVFTPPKYDLNKMYEGMVKSSHSGVQQTQPVKEEIEIDYNDPIGSLVKPINEREIEIKKFAAGESTGQITPAKEIISNEVTDLLQKKAQLLSQRFDHSSEAKMFLEDKLDPTKLKLKEGKEFAFPNVLSLDDYTEESIIEASPKFNETTKIALKQYQDNNRIKEALANSNDLEGAAIYNAKKKKGLQGQQVTALGTNVDIPNAMKGNMVMELLSDPDLQEAASEDPELAKSIRNETYNFPSKYPRAAARMLSQIISKEREERGMNSWLLNNPSVENSEEIINDLFQKGELPAQYKSFYDKPENKFAVNFQLKTPGLVENIGKGLEQGILGIGKTVADVTQVRKIYSSQEDRLYNTLQKDYENFTFKPKGLLHNISMHGGNITGQVLPMMVGGVGLRGAGIINSDRAANAIMVGLQTFGENRDRALADLPNASEGQQFAYATVNTGIEMALANMLNDTKLARDLMRGASPQVKNILQRFTNKEISAAAAKQEVQNVFSKLVGVSGKFIKGQQRTAIREANEEASTQILQTANNQIFGGEPLSVSQQAQDAFDVWSTTYLGSQFLGLGGGVVEVNKNPEMGNVIFEMASNPEKYIDIIKGEAATNPKYAADVEQKLDNLQYIIDVKKELDTRTIKDQDKGKFLLKSLSEKMLTDKKKTVPDKSLNKEADKQLKEIEIEKEAIINPDKSNSSIIEEFYDEELIPNSDRVHLEAQETGKFSPNKIGEYLKYVAQQANNLDENWNPHEGDAPKMPHYPPQLIEMANERWAKEIEKSVPDRVKEIEKELSPPIDQVRELPDENTPDEKSEPAAPEGTIPESKNIEDIKKENDRNASTEINRQLKEYLTEEKEIDLLKGEILAYEKEIERLEKIDETGQRSAEEDAKLKNLKMDLPDKVSEIKSKTGTKGYKIEPDSDIKANKIREDMREISKKVRSEYDKKLESSNQGTIPVDKSALGSVEGKTDAEIENRMSKIEGDKNSKDEFNSLEKEMQNRERNSVFSKPLDKVSSAVDALMQKDKDMPNGFGSFIEKADAAQTKEVAEKYLNADKLSDAQVKSDFKNAVMGNPDTWYADGLRLRESMKEATKRGIETQDLVKEVEAEFIKDGYTAEDAKATVARKLAPIFEGSQSVNQKQLPESLLGKEQTQSQKPKVDEAAPIQDENDAIEKWLEGSEHSDYISFEWDGESLQIFKSRDEAPVVVSREDLEQEGVELKKTKTNETTNDQGSQEDKQGDQPGQSQEPAKREATETGKKTETAFSKKAREIAAKIKADGLRAALPDWAKADLPEGTQQSGFGGKFLGEAIAKAINIVADAVDAGAEIAEAIKQGYASLKEYYDKNAKSYDEKKVKRDFEINMKGMYDASKAPPQTPADENVDDEDKPKGNFNFFKNRDLSETGIDLRFLSAETLEEGTGQEVTQPFDYDKKTLDTMLAVGQRWISEAKVQFDTTPIEYAERLFKDLKSKRSNLPVKAVGMVSLLNSIDIDLRYKDLTYGQREKLNSIRIGLELEIAKNAREGSLTLNAMRLIHKLYRGTYKFTEAMAGVATEPVQKQADEVVEKMKKETTEVSETVRAQKRKQKEEQQPKAPKPPKEKKEKKSSFFEKAMKGVSEENIDKLKKQIRDISSSINCGKKK